MSIKITQAAIEAANAAYWKWRKQQPATYRWTADTRCELATCILEAALPHLQPQPAPPAPATQVAIDDAEVERVGKAIYDEVALQPIVAIGPYVADPTHEASRNARWAARAAIRAVREGGRGA